MGRKKLVLLEVANNGAVYINNVRATGRESKPYGYFDIVFSQKVRVDHVTKVLQDNNFTRFALEDSPESMV